MYRDEFGHRCNFVRRKLGLSQKEEAELLEWATNTVVSRLERGASESIQIEAIPRLIALAEKAGFSAQWLLTGQEVSPAGEFTKEQLMEQLVRIFALDLAAEKGLRLAEGREPAEADKTEAAGPTHQAFELVEPGYRLVYPEDLPADWHGRYVPVIGAAAAGKLELDTSLAESTPPGWAMAFVAFEGAPPAAFAVHVTGDSMTPKYGDGDLVIVDGDKPVKSGVCCAIVRDGDRRLVRLKKLKVADRKATLSSLNRDYEPTTVAASKVKAYKAIDHLPAVVRKSPE